MLEDPLLADQRCRVESLVDQPVPEGWARRAAEFQAPQALWEVEDSDRATGFLVPEFGGQEVPESEFGE